MKKGSHLLPEVSYTWLRKNFSEVSRHPMRRVEPTANEQTSFWVKANIAALLALLLVHALVTYVAVVPGYINVDEGIYHWMVHSYPTRGTLELWNGVCLSLSCS
jgi:hypothetical protein